MQQQAIVGGCSQSNCLETATSLSRLQLESGSWTAWFHWETALQYQYRGKLSVGTAGPSLTSKLQVLEQADQCRQLCKRTEQANVYVPQAESKTTIPLSSASWTGASKLLPKASRIIQCCWWSLSLSTRFVNPFILGFFGNQQCDFIPSSSSGIIYVTSARSWYTRPSITFLLVRLMAAGEEEELGETGGDEGEQDVTVEHILVVVETSCVVCNLGLCFPRLNMFLNSVVKIIRLSNQEQQ